MPGKKDCGQWTAIALTEDLRPIAVPITCKSWTCEHCKKRLKRRLIAKLRTSTPNLFITLTTSPRTAPTPDAAWKIASDCFGRLIKRWRRRFPTARLEYWLVWEKTKRGWPHIHALLEAPLVSKHWLSHSWNELTRSYVVDIQQLANKEHAIAYVSKYLTKDPQVPEGHRRWRRSAGFFRHDAGSKELALPPWTAWTLVHRSPQALTLTFLLHGLAVFTTKEGVIHARDDPPTHTEQLSVANLQRLNRALYPHERAAALDWPFPERAGLPYRQPKTA